MSTVKISELAAISQLNSDTANTIFVGVDLPSGITGKITATTIASGLYSRNKLNVGTTPITLPNTVGQFADTSSQYIQINLVNTNNQGTADYVVGANTGTDTTSYLDIGFTNSLYSNTSPYNSLGTAIEPLSGYLYAQGTTAGASGGNLVLGTTTPGTETRFLAGGINTQNVAMKITSAGPRINTGFSLIFGDGTTQNTAAATLAYSTAGFNQANSANILAQAGFNQANSANVLAQSAFNQANTANVLAQAGFNQANTANVLAQAGFNQANTANVLAQAAFNQANTANVTAQAAFNKANNALANTSGTFAGNLVITGNMSANGITANGEISTFTGYVNPQKGIIYTPVLYPNAQTAITIDFANNSVIKTNTSAGLVVSFTNYTQGKMIDLWVTNVSGSTQTLTHGCSAINSTRNATSFSMAGGQSAYLKYMSFGSDLANTFVAVVYG